MKIVSYRVYEGRNIYSHKKCVRLDLDLQGYAEIPSKDIEEFNEKIIGFLPELYGHRCGIYEEGGFVKRLAEGTYLAHICEHIILALHERIGIEVGYGKAREKQGELYYIIFEYRYKDTAMTLAKIAVDMINCLCKQKAFDLDKRLKIAKKVLAREIMGPSTAAIIEAAKKRNIPCINLFNSGIYQLGYGKYGKIIEATVVHDTRCTAVDVACDKYITKLMLENQYIPVARGALVKTSLELLIQGEAIGYPLVLKPRYGNHGKGVMVNIKNQQELIKAFKELKNNYRDIIIEKYHKGNDYRICLVDGKIVAAALRIPPFIIGDGKQSVKKLIKNLNSDKNRGEDHEKPLTKIKIDESLMQTIAKFGYTINSILPSNEKLFLRENANISTGGVAVDCTDDICRENIEIFKRASETIGLNVCGIDVCAEDLSIPLIENNGIIIEINAAPGIRMHHYPWKGEKRDVGSAIIDMMFKVGEESIPIAAVTGTNGKTTTTRLIAHTLRLKGLNVGMTTTDGIYINDECVDGGDDTGYSSARTILLNKKVEAAVLETARGGIIKSGLGYDLADVGVITNITEDHLGIDDINTLEDLAKVKSLIIEAVKPDGYSVINGDDVVSRTIINRAKGHKIIFSKQWDNIELIKNIAEGEYGVYVKDGAIYVQKERKIFYIADIVDIPMTIDGALEYNIENALAACATLVGLGVDYCLISKGLKTFNTDEIYNPGRFNVYNINGGKVILDYGHNIEGYKAVLTSLKKMKPHRLIGIIGVPGDRLDSNIIEVGKISGELCDYIFIKEDLDRRGRRKGEVAAFLEKGVKSMGNNGNYSIVLDEKDALEAALGSMKENDIVVIFFEEYEPLVQIIKKYRNKQEVGINLEEKKYI